VLLDVTIVNVALPQIGARLGAGVAGLQWVASGYALALATLLLAGGTVGDRLAGIGASRSRDARSWSDGVVGGYDPPAAVPD